MPAPGPAPSHMTSFRGQGRADDLPCRLQELEPFEVLATVSNRLTAAAILGLCTVAVGAVVAKPASAPGSASQAIHAQGTYGPGSYYLAQDIVVAKGHGLVFTGSATLDLRGHAIATSQTGNDWDIGIKMEGQGSRLTDSSHGKGRVSGFRVGVALSGGGSRIVGGDYSGNRYIGIWIRADDVEVRGVTIARIGGVSDEKYAIGVQLGEASNCLVSRARFEDLYPQARYAGDGPGEALAVNFWASSRNCTMRGSVAINAEPRSDTIAVFAGSVGGHTIDDNVVHNFVVGLAASSASTATLRDNIISIQARVPGSIGISGRGAVAAGNIVMGPFETGIDVGRDEGNVTMKSRCPCPP